MRLIIAHPFNGHAVDDEIDVDPAEGKALIRDGLARPASHAERSLKDLRAYAHAEGIDLGGARTKDDVLNAISAAEATRGQSSPAIGGNE